MSSNQRKSEEASSLDSGSNEMSPQGQIRHSDEPKVFETGVSHEIYAGRGRLVPPAPGDEKDFRVDYVSDDDPGNPLNWSRKLKYMLMAVCASAAMATVSGSALIGPSTPEIQQEFHVGLPVATLNVSLYIAGFAIGPIVWGPFSERVGRYIPLCLGMFGLTVFAFGAATAKDFQTLVLCRFFAGALGASTISVGPAMVADIFHTKERGRAMAIVSLIIVAGPMLAPVIGGYITASYLHWRWTQYILGIFSALILVFCVFLLRESYTPSILSQRALQIRRLTGNWAMHGGLDETEFNWRDLLQRTIGRPIHMLFVEPILFLISLFHAFIYGILYLCLEAIPIIFAGYGWHGGNIFLPYIGMMIGAILVVITQIVVFEPIFVRKLKASGKMVLPEERLPLMMVCGIVFPMGIFLLCWSGAYHVMWFVPTLGAAFIGFGLFGIFMCAFNYIIDTYLMLAASAIAANTFLRSGFGAAFPLFAHPMFINLGTQWAGTLLGCLGALMAPVPFLFYFYGERIRRTSKYAVDLDSLPKPPAPRAPEPPKPDTEN